MRISETKWRNVGTPQKIYFTNGSVTKYSYSASGQKLSVEYYVATPNVTVPFGTEPDALTQGQTMYAGSRQYLLGGSLVMEDGMLDMFLFDGGYAKASAVNPTTYTFSFYYYNQDHLGNNREVVDSAGTVKQVTNYYPFGAPYTESSSTMNASLQRYKYNGKEIDRMHGLDTYDYGARQYNPVTARWDRMDPLCEKYYSISPYAYCSNNPIMMVDPDGRDGMITGQGTKDDPYVVTAVYYYQTGSLNKDQVKGLNAAIADYNKLGGKDGFVVNVDGIDSYVKFNLSAQQADDPKEARRANTCFETDGGTPRYYGNIVGTDANTNTNDEYGSANSICIDFNVNNINKGVARGLNRASLNKGVAIHEIGHNLGGQHSDITSTMSNVITYQTTDISGQISSITNYPSVSKKFCTIIIQRHDSLKANSDDGRLWKKKEK